MGSENDSESDLRGALGMSAHRAPLRLAPGQVIDDAYRIEEELAVGGMGRVYRAFDLKLAREVAIKLQAIAIDADSLRREAMALARLAHPNVVSVFEVGTWAGRPWVAMEYVRGGTARSWLREGTRTPREIVELFIAAGRGLAAAHAAGLVHRDFKPENVLIGEDGRPRVADFGLAHDVEGDPQLPRGAIGTPRYMAPEQQDGGAVDTRADQYAFAVSLWEALTGAMPWTANERRELVAPPSERMPRRVEVALRRALHADPDERWPSMEALLDALTPPQRSRRVLVVASALALGGIALGAWALLRSTAPPGVSCDAVDEELATVWSPAARASLVARLAKNDVIAERAATVVDNWAKSWREGRLAACRATHVEHRQSATLLDLRIACLDRASASLRATLATIDAGNVSPARALDAVTALPRVSECANTSLLVNHPALAQDFVTITTTGVANALVARTRALRTSGNPRAAVEAGRRAATYADTHRVHAASARARVELAAAIHATGTMEGVRATFEEAVRYAAEARDDALVARTWMNVIDVVAVRLAKPEEADMLVKVAEAAIVRAGNPPFLEGLLAGSRADLLQQRSRYAESIPLYERRLAAGAEFFGANDVDEARWHNRLATAHIELGQLAQARAPLARAEQIIEGHYGSGHPHLGVLLTTRGDLESMAGNLTLAMQLYERALQIKIAASGPDHATLAATLHGLGAAQADAGQLEAARATATRTAEIATRTLPPKHPKIGLALSLRGRVEVELGLWAEAAETLARASEILEPAGEQPPLDVVDRALVSVHLHAGDLQKARAAADRALRITTRVNGDSLVTARSLYELARVQARARDTTIARETHARAVAMARAKAGPAHPVVAQLAHEPR